MKELEDFFKANNIPFKKYIIKYKDPEIDIKIKEEAKDRWE